MPLLFTATIIPPSDKIIAPAIARSKRAVNDVSGDGSGGRYAEEVVEVVESETADGDAGVGRGGRGVLAGVVVALAGAATVSSGRTTSVSVEVAGLLVSAGMEDVAAGTDPSL